LLPLLELEHPICRNLNKPIINFYSHSIFLLFKVIIVFSAGISRRNGTPTIPKRVFTYTSLLSFLYSPSQFIRDKYARLKGIPASLIPHCIPCVCPEKVN